MFTDQVQLTIRRRRKLIVLIGAAILAALGVLAHQSSAKVLSTGDRNVLDAPDSVMLYRIIAHPDEQVKAHTPPDGLFHDYVVLGKAAITDPRDRRMLRDKLYSSLGNGEIMACYDPGFAIHASRGKRFVDLVICFDCLQMELWDNGRKTADTISRDPLPFFKSLSAEYRIADPD